MQPPKSREHRIRVLENLAKHAGDRGARPEPGGAGQHQQLKMPLIVEVKGTPGTKQRVRRPRRKPQTDQRGLEDL
jgi:hypothetical protein